MTWLGDIPYQEPTVPTGTTVIERSKLRLFWFLVIPFFVSYFSVAYSIGALLGQFSITGITVSAFFGVVFADSIPLVAALTVGHSMFRKGPMAILSPEGLKVPTLGQSGFTPWDKVVFAKGDPRFMVMLRVCVDPDNFLHLPLRRSLYAGRKRAFAQGRGYWIFIADVNFGGRWPLLWQTWDYREAFGKGTDRYGPVADGSNRSK